MGLYLDDLVVGQRFETESMTVTEADIIAFAKQFDPQYYHVDPVAAQKSAFGGLIASGFHTLSASMRLFFDLNLWPEAIIASPGMEHVKWLKPLRPGDTIRAAADVVDVRMSSSKPDRGVVTMDHPCWNQADEMILTFRCAHMLRRRTT
ncbi:acyl dehydratase [Pseudorhodoplanes sinuspersici]|uniref:Acyl dehydratase n=2 Tax=Pseudorhodoplanes sinuspersici TaxID=1235591 RepID=A0A1W6ZSD4_9HYPH|nr:acyl dehydratase [Pseudorhodoplanes sinuspersici]RKE67609.1 acyl dehydratase [Pseudorhodoplanes sinuspersici]